MGDQRGCTGGAEKGLRLGVCFSLLISSMGSFLPISVQAQLTNIDLATNFTTDRGFAIYGSSSVNFGCSVAGVGDTDRDGFSDVVVGAKTQSVGEQSYAGVSYLIYGGAAIKSINVTKEFTQARGIALYGVSGLSNRGGGAGYSVSGGGDINGDGYDDVIIAGYQLGYGQVAYVVYGGKGRYSDNSLRVFLQDPSRGLGLFPISGDLYGANQVDVRVVSLRGDINGDGYADAVIAGVEAGGYFPSVIVFGGTGLSNRNVTASNFSLKQGVFLYGGSSGAGNGLSITSGGDVNGDGYDDVIVGDPYSSPATAYVVYGGKSLSNSYLNGNFSSAQGFSVLFPGNNILLFSLSFVGDMNKDGYGDFMIGGRGLGGLVYLLYGGSHLTSLNMEEELPVYRGVSISGDDDLGDSISGAGDVNGDGYSDAVLGNYQVAYVVYGGQNLSNINLSKNFTEGQGFSIFGSPIQSVSDAGDVNGDGVDDVILGGNGAAYVVYGKSEHRESRGGAVLIPVLATVLGVVSLVGGFLAWRYFKKKSRPVRFIYDAPRAVVNPLLLAPSVEDPLLSKDHVYETIDVYEIPNVVGGGTPYGTH